MGIVFGATGVEEPSYQTIVSSTTLPLEIRLYQPYFIAEVRMAETGESQSFNELAKYIGVFGNPQNIQKSPLAMTAPVITHSQSQSIKMTAPVLTSASDDKKGPEYMAFVLPFEYKDLSQVPVPTSQKVTIKSIPSKLIAVTRFSGSYRKDFFAQKHSKLVNDLVSEEYVSAEQRDSLEWSIAQYHPPFTLPFLRRNEIWVELGENNDFKRVTPKLLQIIKNICK